MTRTVYRLPDVDLFLRQDDVVMPAPEPDDDVVELTQDHAGLLTEIYGGAGLERLTVRGGGGASPPPTDDNFVKLMFAAFAFLPYGPEYLGFVNALNDLVAGRHGEDPLLRGLQRIHDELAGIKDDILASWVTDREEHLSGVLAQSSAALHTANDFLKAKADRRDPVWAAKIALAETNSLIAVKTFTEDIDRGYWRRPFSIKAISLTGDPTSFYRGWLPHLPDRADVDGLNRVWDYRWAMPALLTTITIRLAVLTAFSTGERVLHELFRDEVRGYIGVLNRLFAKRWDGLRRLDHLSPQQRDHFATAGRFPMVAVDIYGGAYLGGIYYLSDITRKRFSIGEAPDNFWDFYNSPNPFDLTWVDHNVRRFGEHWWNLLYIRTGLEDVFLFLSHLWALYDAPWVSKRITELDSWLRDVVVDDEKRTKAALATTLSATASLDPVARTALTHRIFESLDRGGERADEIVRQSVKDLERLF